jgi:hypothetical protein
MAEKLDPNERQLSWMPSRHALECAQRIYLEDLTAVDLVGLTGWLTGQLQRGSNDDREHCRVYADALYDMSRLIAELRFETSLAAVYIADLGERLCSEERDRSELSGIFVVPGMAVALLSPQLEDRLSLERIFTDPTTPVGGNRVLAGWFTAQLLDSALMRSIAALDCIAILLWSAAGRPFSMDSQGNLMLPAFCQKDLELIERQYGSSPAWSSLYGLTESGYIEMVRQYRYGFIHRRRAPTELHGGVGAVVRFGGDGAAPTLSKRDQLKMIQDFYHEVLHAATGLAGELLRSGDSSGRGED